MEPWNLEPWNLEHWNLATLEPSSWSAFVKKTLILAGFIALTSAPVLTWQQAATAPAPAPAAAAQTPNIIADVRAAIAKNDFKQGEETLKAFRTQYGTTPEAIEALSWLGRGALGQKLWNMADAYAKDARALVLEALKTRELDAEKHLPLALGATYEVEAQVLAHRDKLADAVHLLQGAIEQYKNTSIYTRLQKNVNILTLEGKPAPALTATEFLGNKSAELSELKGKPVVLFFWAHWCPDCKMEAPILAKLLSAYQDKGLVVLAPTQRYGYVAGGKPATPQEELAHIENIRNQHYAAVDMAVPISEADFKSYGASTTPTIVLVDRRGIVRLYHPGRMTEEELEPKVKEIL
jgi:thiol-disulfide isomerase/thioredoxin